MYENCKIILTNNHFKSILMCSRTSDKQATTESDVLLFLLDLDTRQDMHNQNEVVL